MYILSCGRKGYIIEMEEAPEKGKKLSHSAHANGMNEYIFEVEIEHRGCSNHMQYNI
jgi:hypothetical protein